jgi:hypothetical protein
MKKETIEETAVEWLWNKIALKLSFEQVNKFLPIFEQAKEIEKENMINFLKSVFGMEGFDYEQSLENFKKKIK